MAFLDTDLFDIISLFMLQFSVMQIRAFVVIIL